MPTDEVSRIKRAVDDGGHWAQYDYNADGMLNSVILSSGRQRHFDYDGVLMTRITDEIGHVLLKNLYASRFLRQQQFGNGDVHSYRYDWAPTAYYPDRVVVTLPDQTTRDVVVNSSVPEFVRNLPKQ